MTSATGNRTTELLRKLLDEHGVEWASGRTNANLTSWNKGDLRINAKELSDGTLLMQQYSRKHFTPEQAIAATLGSGTLTAEQVREAIRKYAENDSCYIFEVYGEMCGLIADELNAAIGGGECEFSVVKESIPGIKLRGDICECGNCGYRCPYGLIEDERFKCCPGCGARMKAVKR